MKDGWYAIANVKQDKTLHYILENHSLCKSYPVLSKILDRISTPAEIIEIHKCLGCRKILTRYEETGICEPIKFIANNSNAKKLKEKLAPTAPKLTVEQYNQVQARCPSCKTKVCFYTDGIPKEHYCTVCKKMVELSKEVLSPSRPSTLEVVV